MLRKGEVVYLDRVEADWPLRLHLPVGSTVPPHCSASGKLLVASLPAAEREALVAQMPLPRFTQRTITDRALLARELDRIIDAGYAVDDEEYVLGVACVAVPVRLADGQAIAAVAVHAATARLPLHARHRARPAPARGRAQPGRHLRMTGAARALGPLRG